MAQVILIEPLRKRIAGWLKRQRVCRFCGEVAEPLRGSMDYTFLEKWAVACPNRCEPVYHSWAPSRLDRLNEEISINLGKMIDVWNDRNDMPAFIAGLA
jgi:hypothetical protein